MPVLPASHWLVVMRKPFAYAPMRTPTGGNGAMAARCKALHHSNANGQPAWTMQWQPHFLAQQLFFWVARVRNSVAAALLAPSDLEAQTAPALELLQKQLQARSS